MQAKKFKVDLAGREMSVELGGLAQQADGAVFLTYGQTALLATCVMSKEPREVDYLPLTVEYEERLYAAGKIKTGRFMKREGRAPDEAILTGRMIDRAIRPCFDQRIRNEIQVVVTVLSFDRENDPDILGLMAASLCLGVSRIPWNGPVAALRVGRLSTGQAGEKQDWILNPTYENRDKSDLDLIVAGKENGVNMLEGGANQVPEDVFVSAIGFVQPYLKQVIDFQKQVIETVNPQKAEPIKTEIDPSLYQEARKWLGDKLEQAIYQPDKRSYQEGLDLLQKELISALTTDFDEAAKESARHREKVQQVKDIFYLETDRVVHKNIVKAEPGKERRPDGRKLDEVRPIECQLGILPRVHGAGLFQRGGTQALSIVTLGAPGEEQTIESMEVETKKQFMHHYNFPPFCTGEVKPMRGPGRREIGHGALAERALAPLIPEKSKFPYTIRVVSEILASNGSSSMASVSGSSLALMDAGVPIKTHATGVAMGLMLDVDDKENFRVLTDIQGPEDHHGDMDCKIAGTQYGVTACQMDVKIEGVNLNILKRTFEQAKQARLSILAKMEQAIAAPRAELSPLAPRIIVMQIDSDKIRVVIGPGGKMINEIIDQTGVKIDIEDDGRVYITSTNGEGAQKAVKWIENLTHEVKKGEVFQGKVVKITDFGAFLEILPGQEGLAHISELADFRVNKVEDILKTGQIVPVKVKDIDEQGRIKLTLKGLDK